CIFSASISPTRRDTLELRLAASMRTQSSTWSSTVMVTFFMPSVYTNFVEHELRVVPELALQPHFRGARVRLQALAIRQLGRDPAKLVSARFADFDDAASLLEIVDPERAGESGRG